MRNVKNRCVVHQSCAHVTLTPPAHHCFVQQWGYSLLFAVARCFPSLRQVQHVWGFLSYLARERLPALPL